MIKGKEIRMPGLVVYGDGGYDRDLAKQSVGKGWHGLIDEVFDMKEKSGTNIIQVKEKYAGLRIYISGYGYTNAGDAIYNDEFEKFIMDVEYRSFKICEQCGKPGKVRGKGWYYTSCDEHAKDGDVPHEYQPGDKYAEQEK